MSSEESEAMYVYLVIQMPCGSWENAQPTKQANKNCWVRTLFLKSKRTRIHTNTQTDIHVENIIYFVTVYAPWLLYSNNADCILLCASTS